MTRCLMCLAAFGLISAGNWVCAADETGQEALQGNWQCTVAEMDGKADEDIVDDQVIFEGTKMTIKQVSGKPDEVSTFTLDPAASPKAIDLRSQRNQKVILGIYELSGETLKLCFNKDENGERPKDFSTAPKSRRMLVTLKRAKP